MGANHGSHNEEVRMRKVALGWLVIMLVVQGLGEIGRTAPPPQIIEVGENAACDYHTIEDAIAAAYSGDTIKVQWGVFYEQPLVVNKSLTFFGGYVKAAYGDIVCLGSTGYQATVRPAPGASGPLFRVQGANVHVQWFIFENGTDEGVAVDSGGTLDLVESIVQNNGDGGLSVVGATANLLETEILNNNRNYGGGIYMSTGASVTASDSLIKGNDGWFQGAGVYLEGGSVFNATQGTRIELNVTTLGCYDGGGIAAIGAGTEVTIAASQVLSNTALSRGGGLYLAGGAQTWIRNGSVVQGNRAIGPGVGGGGVYLADSLSSLHVDGSRFSANSADPNGGGIYSNFGTVHLNNARFNDNQARDNGGAVYNSGGSVTCRNSYFDQNWVLNDHGGAISSIEAVGTLDVERTAFLQNSTDSGNGGAIFTDQPYTSVRRSYFTGNTAPGDGSALFLSGMHLPPMSTREAVIENNYIVDNPTPAVVPDGGEAAPTGIEDPEGPPAYGSSLYAESITAYLRHNTFAHQTRLPHFGVLADAEATVHMVNNILTNFNVAFHRYTTGTGFADASHTLFWNNLHDYGTGTLASTNEVLGDPAFSGGTNYNLTGSSAAINTGTDAGVYVDYYGASRPWGGGFEIGAQEYPRRLFLPLVMR
jgi:hypothetical protein